MKNKEKTVNKYKTIVVLIMTIIVSFYIYNSLFNDYDKRLNNYPYAKELYKNKGNFESSYRLGLFYLEKLKDKEKAFYWLKKSSSSGSQEATIKLIKIDKNKNKWVNKAFELGVSPLELAKIDSDNSNKWLNIAAEAGDCNAMKIIAKKLDRNYRNNLDDIFDQIVLVHREKTFGKAITWYEKAYQNGCKEVVNDIALLYRANTTSYLRSIPKYTPYSNIGYMNKLTNNIKSSTNNNYKKAEEWIKKGVNNGNAKSLKYLGDIYRFEKKDLYLAINYYKKGYKKGEKDSFNALIDTYKTLNNEVMTIYLYLKGLKDNDIHIIKEFIKYLYEKKDYVNAYLLTNKIKNKENFFTKNNIIFKNSIIKESNILYEKINKNLLKHLFEGYKKLFIDTNLEKELSTKFTMKNFFLDNSIITEIGEYYFNNTKDNSKALNNFKLSYEIKKDGLVALKIGVLYMQLHNIKESIKWLEKAFNIHKELNAAFNLGQIYKYHLKKYKNSIKWYKVSYKGGMVSSSYEIGDIYENIFKDNENAILWYKKGADKGFSKSIYKLDNLNTSKENDLSDFINTYKIKDGGNTVILSKDKNIIFVVNSNQGLIILDISKPSNPQLVSSFMTKGEAYEIVITKDETKAYIADGKEGLTILDISNLKKPKLLSKFKVNDSAYSVKISKDGTKIFIADGDSGLQIIDIRDSLKPKLLSTLSIGTIYQVNISTDETRAYIAGDDSGLIVVDIKDSLKPKLLQKFKTGGFVVNVLLSKNNKKAYIADGPKGLKILDIKDYKNIKLLRSINLNGFISNISLSKNEETVYIVNRQKGLQIINNKDFNLKVVNTIKAKDMISDFTLSKDEKTAYIVDDSTGLMIVDIQKYIK